MEAKLKQFNLLGDEPLNPAASERTAGLDEAGRGCLAGPVVAAAVILPESYDLPCLGDSKKLSPIKRKLLAPQIKRQAIAWGIGLVWPRRIELINILQASLEAMAIAAANLKIGPASLLIDGNQKIPHAVLTKFWSKHHHAGIPSQRVIIGGDAMLPCISAASILAKTFRDRLMEGLARLWPVYGFEKHKGYGTKAHCKALADYGPCPQHRLTFNGICAGAAPFPVRDLESCGK